MKSVSIHGIKACDTMKKAFNWLSENEIAYEFQDYKKEAASEDQLREWLEQVKWDELINKRGTSWRKLSDEDKADVDNDKAIKLIMSNNSLIKRPALVVDGKVFLGFKPEQYQEIFS